MDSKVCSCSGQLVFIDESILMHMYVKLGKNSPFVSGIFGPKIHERNTMMLSLYVLLHAGGAEIHSVTCPLPQFENHRKLCFRVKIPEGADWWHVWSKYYYFSFLKLLILQMGFSWKITMFSYLIKSRIVFAFMTFVILVIYGLPYYCVFWF